MRFLTLCSAVCSLMTDPVIAGRGRRGESDKERAAKIKYLQEAWPAYVKKKKKEDPKWNGYVSSRVWSTKKSGCFYFMDQAGVNQYQNDRTYKKSNNKKPTHFSNLICRLRCQYKNKTLEKEYIDALNELDFIWNQPPNKKRSNKIFEENNSVLCLKEDYIEEESKLNIVPPVKEEHMEEESNPNLNQPRIVKNIILIPPGEEVKKELMKEEEAQSSVVTLQTHPLVTMNKRSGELTLHINLNTLRQWPEDFEE